MFEGRPVSVVVDSPVELQELWARCGMAPVEVRSQLFGRHVCLTVRAADSAMQVMQVANASGHSRSQRRDSQTRRQLAHYCGAPLLHVPFTTSSFFAGHRTRSVPLRRTVRRLRQNSLYFSSSSFSSFSLPPCPACAPEYLFFRHCL